MLFWKKIKALEEERNNLQSKLYYAEMEIKEQKDEIKRLTQFKKQMDGERVQSILCQACANSVYDACEGYSCVLNCKCKDFKKKEWGKCH